MKLTMTTVVSDFVLGTDLAKQMSVATLAAVTEAGDLAKTGGRTSIAGGGFSSKWQNALRSKVYENKEKPMGPAALVWHKIVYSSVFERGESVAGKPLLWLPLPQVPLGKGSHPLTPAQYVGRIGPLVSAKRPGGKPMLLGRGTRRNISRATEKVVRVRKKAVKSGSILGDWVPLFIGVPKVDERKRFDVHGAAVAAAAKLPALYDKHMKG